MTNRLIDLSAGPSNMEARLKVGWAKHHLRALDEEMRKWLEGDPYTVLGHDDLKRGEHIISLDIGPIPIVLGLIVGDFTSCLRGALDHLAYALTLTKLGTRNERTYFPVMGTMTDKGRAKFHRDLAGLPVEAISLIDSLQPYHCGDAYKITKLWRLHRLWNIDKHRRIPFFATFAQTNLRCPAHVMPYTCRTENGSEVHFPIAAKGDIYLEPPVDIRVDFGDKDEGIVVPSSELLDIHNFVRNDIFPMFDSFFER